MQQGAHMKSVAVVNGKGGAGKTTTVAVLAMLLREWGRIVTLIDTDPQQTLSLLIDGVEPATAADLGLALRRNAGSDFVFIDTPPALGMELRAASDLADGLLIPTRSTFLDLRGLGNLLAVVDTTKIVGLVIIGWRGHVRHHRVIAGRLEALGYPILARVPFSITLADALLWHRSISQYPPARRIGITFAYEGLREEIEKWSKTG
jgi:cellulose biosynthesis protein BcsQ